MLNKYLFSESKYYFVSLITISFLVITGLLVFIIFLEGKKETRYELKVNLNSLINKTTAPENNILAPEEIISNLTALEDDEGIVPESILQKLTAPQK